MAKFRQFYVGFWRDPEIQEADPVNKLIFAYLFTNDACTESGIYTVTFRTIANETGIDYTTVVERFSKGLKNVYYDYENKVVFVVNFMIYNAGGNPENIKKAIARECKTINTDLWGAFKERYPIYNETIEEIYSQYYDGPPKDWQRFANGCPTLAQQINSNSYSYSNSNSNSNIDNTEKEKTKSKRRRTSIKPYPERVEEYFSGDDIKEMRQPWLDAYPGLDIDKEIKAAKIWLLSNPSKHKKDFRAFLNNWFKRTEQYGAGQPPQAVYHPKTEAEVTEIAIKEFERLRAEAKKHKTKLTDAQLLGYMHTQLGYNAETIEKVIQHFGGRDKLTGPFKKRGQE